MKREQVPVSVYRLTSEQLVAEHHRLCDHAEQLSPNQRARLYFLNEKDELRFLRRIAKRFEPAQVERSLQVAPERDQS